MTIKRSDLRGFAKREAGKEVAIGAEAADMRAVVIVEFWAMMAGGLPFGWIVCESRHYGGFVYASGPGWKEVPSRQMCADMWWGDVWAMEYADRPRIGL